MKPSKVVSFRSSSDNYSNDELQIINSITSALEVILERPADLYFFKPASRYSAGPSGSMLVYGTYRNNTNREVIPFLNREGKPAVDGVVSPNTIIEHIKNGKII